MQVFTVANEKFLLLINCTFGIYETHRLPGTQEDVDINLVASQANVPFEVAKQTLIRNNGNVFNAIIELLMNEQFI